VDEQTGFMATEPKFYERLHAENEAYGRAQYDLNRLAGSRAMIAWGRRFADHRVRLLDIGCGKGQFLLELSRMFAQRFGVVFERIAGLDLVKAEPNRFQEIEPKLEFVQQSVDGQDLPYESGSFHLVCCNHVLEHIFETERFVREIRRIVHADGLAVLSVPNVAAWMNRLAFLFGGQPLGSEVGTEKVTYGFWPPSLKPRLEAFSPSGHIRDFTPGGLRDLSRACGFEPAGWWAQNGGWLIGLNPKLGRNIGILLQPARSGSA